VCVSSAIRCDSNPVQLQSVDRQKPDLARETEGNKEIKVFVPETHKVSK
jgi:hypothetical protein